MSTEATVPTNETHTAVKVCHGRDVVSPILIIPNEDFTSEAIVNKLSEYGFVNKDFNLQNNTHWFQDLKNGCLVFGTEGTKTIFTHSLCMVNVPEELTEDE